METNMNTRFVEREFDYLNPVTLSEALEILDQKENVKIYAGGTDLIVKMKAGAPIVMDYMMDINHIPELQQVTLTEECLEIGAAAKINLLEKDERLKENVPALVEAFLAMASISIRNMATLGGNFCNASPVADAVGPVMCYGGSVVLKSVNGTREIPAEDFFLAPGVTVMNKNEMLTSVKIPLKKTNVGYGFRKMSRVKADIAKISMTVVMEREEDTITSCRISMGSVAARPLYLKEISESIAGQKMSVELIKATAEKIEAFIQPIDDNRTTAEYRKELARVIAEELLAEAYRKSGGDI